MRRWLFLGLAVALPLSPPAAAAPRTHIVVIEKMKFGPVPADVRAGDIIVWKNRDIFRHTATAMDGSFNIDLPAGETGSTLLRRPGTFPFTCKYHPGMRGTLKVAK